MRALDAFFAMLKSIVDYIVVVRHSLYNFICSFLSLLMEALIVVVDSAADQGLGTERES